jgi:hypothetical protein
MDTIPHFHTGRYDLATDRFVGGEVAAFLPDGRVIKAPTVEELQRKYDAEARQDH